MEQSFLSKQDEGIQFFNRSDYASALLIFNQLLEVYPSIKETHYNVAVTLEKLELFEQAKDEMLLVIRMDDSVADYYYHLCIIYSKLNSEIEAEKYIKKAIQLESNNPEYHFQLGQLYFNKNQLLLSNQEYQLAIDSDPDFINAYIQLGNNYRKMERWDEAKLEYEKVLSIFPDDPESHACLSQYYLHFKQWHMALTEILHSLSKISENPIYLNIHANILYSMLQIDKAVEIASDLIRKYPDYSQPYELLGRCFAAKTDYENAITYFEQSKKIDPNNIQAYIGLRTIYERIGDEENYKKTVDMIKKIYSKEETLS